MRKLTFSIFFLFLLISQALATVWYIVPPAVCPGDNTTFHYTVQVRGPIGADQREILVDVFFPSSLQYSGNLAVELANAQVASYVENASNGTFLHLRGFFPPGEDLNSTTPLVSFDLTVLHQGEIPVFLGPPQDDVYFSAAGFYLPSDCVNPGVISSCSLDCPVPDPFSLTDFQNGCFTAKDCQQHGFSWISEVGKCYVTACDYSLEYCSDAESCESHGGFFVNGSCVPTLDCTASTIMMCPDQGSCEYFSGYWYAGSCHQNPCDLYNPNLCTTEDECLNYAFGHWYADAANATPTCHSLSDQCANGQFDQCTSDTACSAAGGHWYDNACHEYACDISDLSRCSTELDCIAAGGTWEWGLGENSTAVCTACSAVNMAACQTQVGCQKPGVGGHWYDGACHSTPCSSDQTCCVENGGTWDNGQCWECNASTLEACQSELSCLHFGGEWDSNSSTCSSGLCDSSHLENCSTQSDCEGAGGYWYDGSCHSTSGCSLSHLENCSEADCANLGKYWFDGKCNECDNDHLYECTSEESCLAADGIWKDGYCSVKSCETGYLYLCKTKDDCEAAGGYWDGESCKDENPCTPEHLDLCKTPEDCEKLGLGHWYDESCHEDPCDAQHLDACKTKEDCETYGKAQWINDQCYKMQSFGCSTKTLYRCITKDDCTVAGGIWANWRCVAPSGSAETPPSNGECQVGNPENCKTEISCILAGGIWDNNKCKRPDTGDNALDPVVSIVEPLSDYNPYLNSYPVNVSTVLTLVPRLKVLQQDIGKVADLYAVIKVGDSLWILDSNGEWKPLTGQLKPFKFSVVLAKETPFVLFDHYSPGNEFVGVAADVFIGYAKNGNLETLRAGAFRLLFSK